MSLFLVGLVSLVNVIGAKIRYRVSLVSGDVDVLRTGESLTCPVNEHFFPGKSLDARTIQSFPQDS